MTVTPPTATFGALGGTVQLAAEVRDGAGNLLPNATVSWQTSAGEVATVSGSGLVTAAGNGNATITGTSGSAAGTAIVTVAQVPRAINVTPPTAALAALGETVALAATVTDSNSRPVAAAPVTWSSSDAAVASVSAAGVVTAVANGTAVITAASGALEATTTVTVAQVVAAISVAPTAHTFQSLGTSLVFAAQVTDARGQLIGTPPVWSTSDAAVATVSLGVVTAIGVGTATISASLGGKTAGALVTVTQVPATVMVSPGFAALNAPGQTVQLTAAVSDANVTPIPGAPVGWTSSNPSVATVSATGLVTAQAAGPATITATSGGVSGQATVTVAQPSMQVSPTALAFDALGRSSQLTAVVRDGAGVPVPGAPVTWQSANPAVATVANGLVSAAGNGSTTVTATSGALSVAIPVTVQQVAASVAVAPVSATLVGIGTTLALTATVRDAVGAAMPGAPVGWASLNPAVATVSAAGVVTSVATGTATISATTSTPGGPVSATAAISVEPALAALVITTQPTSRLAGVAGTAVTVELRRSDGTLATSATNPVTVTLLPGGNGGVLSGPATVNAVGGVATFGVVVSTPGTGYQLQFSTSGLPTVTSAAFAIEIRFQHLAAGAGHTCGVDFGNALWCWGENGDGQLGLGDATDRPAPVRVGTGQWRSVWAGGDNTCGLDLNRHLFCWGAAYGTSTPANIGGTLRLLTARSGTAHGCGIGASGGSYCWGANGSGQLGRGTVSVAEPNPAAIAEPPVFVNLYVGAAFTCALDDQFVGSETAAYCWGADGEGELGNGAGGPTSAPVAVAGGLRFDGLSAAADGNSVCAWRSTGAVWCWGRNAEGELGNGGTAQAETPVAMTGGVSFQSVSMGQRHGCGVAGNQVYCWGRNLSGEAGVAAGGNLLAPTLAAATGMASLRAGRNHTCGLQSTGRAFCWGSNASGQLGSPGAGGPTPQPVSAP